MSTRRGEEKVRDRDRDRQNCIFRPRIFSRAKLKTCNRVATGRFTAIPQLMERRLDFGNQVGNKIVKINSIIPLLARAH